MTISGGDPFAQLASGSLPVLGAESYQPTSWSRSLGELKAANESFLSGRPLQPSAGARTLLRDQTDYGRLAGSLKPPKQPKTEAGVSVEQMLRQHRDGIMERILTQCREHTRRKADELVEKQLQEDWEKEKAWWLRETVGATRVGGSGNAILALEAEQRETSHQHAMLSGPSPCRMVNTGGIFSPSLDGSLVQGHLEVVKSLKAHSTIQDMMQKFQKIPTLGSAQESCYSDALQLMSEMLSRYNRPIDGTIGALIHFCKQFQNLITNRVRVASLARQDVSTPHNFASGLVNTVAAYVKLEFAATDAIWHILYFCLRCGDAVAANTALASSATQDEMLLEGPVRRAISQLAQKQGDKSCLFESFSPGYSNPDRPALGDLFDRTKTMEPTNVYKLGTLALLSEARSLPSTESRGFSTIEDYMFGSLWQIVQNDSPTDEIVKLGGIIRSFGSGYFGNEETGGWSYALPLLASQQFRTALTYLADAGGSMGLLQATHVAIMLSVAGVPVHDVGDRGSSESILTALLIAYSAKLEMDPASGPTASLQYLLRISPKKQSLKEIAGLVARSYSTQKLAGTISSDGTRHEAILDTYLSNQEVSLVLADAAELFQKEAYDRSKAQAALTLYMLAGRYFSVLTLLNSLVAPPDKQDGDQIFWCNQSEMFHNTYLARRTLVLESLERENSSGLVSTNRILTGLRRFFDLLNSGRFDEAWDLLRRFELLPNTPNEMASKLSNYHSLDPVLRNAFPAIIKGAMVCLHSFHSRAKQDRQAISSITQSRLSNLQGTARLLTSFAGQAHMPSDMQVTVSRLEAQMI